jgi:hypothetical protein
MEPKPSGTEHQGEEPLKLKGLWVYLKEPWQTGSLKPERISPNGSERNRRRCDVAGPQGNQPSSAMRWTEGRGGESIENGNRAGRGGRAEGTFN